MHQKKLLVIICVTAGKQDSVANEIRDILDESNTKYRIIKIDSPLEIPSALKKIRLHNYIAAAVYGGDGTIIAALKAFGGKRIPILIMPGGTANVLANYYNMPATIGDCLSIFTTQIYVTERVDIADVNGDPLILDIHMGLWTQAIKSTSRKHKKRVGEAAYAWSALKQASNAPLQTYEFSVNTSEPRVVKGYTFLIANQGNHNVLGVPLFPYNHAPGMIQIAIVKSVKAVQLISWFFGRLIGKNMDSVIEIHRAKNVTISKAPKSVLSDDISRKLRLPIVITAGEYSAWILIPPSATDTSSVRLMLRKLSLWKHRMAQRFRHMVFASPSLRYSHVAPNVYLGGKYSARSFGLFKRWGITGIISMRTGKSPAAPEGIEQLSLPTKDWHPPKLKDLRRGVGFMTRHIDKGGSVYVHCQLGEGRGPTMAAAYLITKGFTVDEAIQVLTKYRPVVQPNANQRQRLAEWQEYFNAT